MDSTQKTIIEKMTKIYTDIIKIAESIRSELESQLASEPPALRHGDYGIFKHDKQPWIVMQRNETLEWYGKQQGSGTNVNRLSESGEIIHLGNLADDLSAMAEEVTSFELDVNEFYINMDSGLAHAPIHIAGNNHTLDEAEQYHRDFGAMLCTYKTKLAALRKAKGESK